MLGMWGMNIPQRHFGGFETGFSEIAPRLVEMGHQVTIYCRRGEYQPDWRVPVHNGVRLVYLPSPGGKNFAGPVSTLLATLHARAFGAHDLFFFVNVGMGHHCALSRVLGKKVVLNVNGLDWTRAKWGPVAQWYFLSAAKMAIRVCNVLVTDAYAMQDFYRTEFDKETRMIAYGAYVESSIRPELITQFGLEPDSYYLIASRLIPENNPDLIVEAFFAAESSKRLVIAGGANYDSPFHRRLRSLAADHPGRLILTGHINDQAVIKELHCNCFAYVHGHSVGGTNPALLKAMGYGNCVLAYDTPFNREVLADTGVFWPKSRGALATLMRELEADPATVRRLRTLPQPRIVAEYTWDKISRQYEALFREVCA
jgi:glycosyltransferase involved in cell wall biosynthesis